nr:MAG TPA: hypothetical protein [Caudoviricetes sp.]
MDWHYLPPPTYKNPIFYLKVLLYSTDKNNLNF